MDEIEGSVLDISSLPPNFPTQFHASEFWQALGRTVATFGFLEEVLGKAIFAFTYMREVPQTEINATYAKWRITLQHALSDALGSLIVSYERAVKGHGAARLRNFDQLIDHLKQAKGTRNVLCHGSWSTKPDAAGRSIPFFVDDKRGVFNTPIDVAYLERVQHAAMELACQVINTVTIMGWQFPGSNSPGMPFV